MKFRIFVVLLVALLIGGCDNSGSPAPSQAPASPTGEGAPAGGPPSPDSPVITGGNAAPAAVPGIPGQPADAGSAGQVTDTGSPGQVTVPTNVGQVTVTAGDIANIGARIGEIGRLGGLQTGGTTSGTTTGIIVGGGPQPGGTTTGETEARRVDAGGLAGSLDLGSRVGTGTGAIGTVPTTLSVDPNVEVILRDTEDPRAIKVLFKLSGDPTLGGSGVAMDLSDSANIISTIVIAADTSVGDGRCVQHAEGQRPATITSQSGTAAGYTVGDIPDNGVILTLAQNAASLMNGRKYCLIIDDPNHYIKSTAGDVLGATSVTVPFVVPDLHQLVVEPVVPVMSGETMTKLLVTFKRDGDSTGDAVAMDIASFQSVITNNGIAVFDNSNTRVANISSVADAAALVPNTIEMTLANPISIPRGTQGQFNLKIEDTNRSIKSAEGFFKLKELETVSPSFQNPLTVFLNKVSQIPAEGATAACPDKPITIDFDKDLDSATAATGTTGNITLTKAQASVRIVVSVSDKRLTITPTPPTTTVIPALGLKETYVLTVKSGATGLKAVSPGGEPLQSDIVVNFTTAEVGCGHVGMRPIVANFSSGDSFSCMVESDGKVGCWGKNNRGQLGIGTSPDSSVSMKSIVGVGNKVFKGVKTGDSHACAFTDTEVYCWGNNSSGQLGTGTSSSSSSPSPVLEFPNTGRLISAVNIKDLALGSDSSCAVVEVVVTTQLAKLRYLYCWGKLKKADGSDIKLFGNKAVVADTATNWKNVFASAQTVCATKSDKSLWCMGRNDKGQLGDSTIVDRDVMTQVVKPAGLAATDMVAWKDVDISHDMTCGIATVTSTTGGRTASELMCWGDAFSGIVSIPNMVFSDTTGITEFAVYSGGSTKTILYVLDGALKYFINSQHVFAYPGTNWGDVDFGTSSYCGIRDEPTFGKRLYCVGLNQNGQLGIGESDMTKGSLIPMPVVKPIPLP